MNTDIQFLNNNEVIDEANYYLNSLNTSFDYSFILIVENNEFEIDSVMIDGKTWDVGEIYRGQSVVVYKVTLE